MKISKFAKITFIGLVSVFMLAACGKKEKESDNDGQVSIRFSWWGNDERHKATLEMIEKFEKENPNIKVKAEYSGWDGIEEKMTTQIAGGTEADLMQMGYDWYLTYSPDGDGFYDLNNLKDEIDFSGYSKEIIEDATFNGKLNGIIFGQNAFSILLNKTTYDKLGVSIPTTWEEYIASAEKFPEGSYPFITSGFNLVNVYLTQQTGKTLLDKDGNVNYTAEEIKSGLDWQQELVDKGVIPGQKEIIENIGSNNISTVKQFIEGDYAGATEWSSSAQNFGHILEENGQELNLPVFPTSSNSKTQGVIKQASMLFSISKNTKHPKETAKLLNFMLNEKEGVLSLGTKRGVPINSHAVEILNEANQITELDKTGVDYMNNTEGAAQGQYYGQPAMSSTYNDIMEQFGLGVVTSKEASEMLVEQLQAVSDDIKSNLK